MGVVLAVGVVRPAFAGAFDNTGAGPKVSSSRPNVSGAAANPRALAHHAGEVLSSLRRGAELAHDWRIHGKANRLAMAASHAQIAHGLAVRAVELHDTVKPPAGRATPPVPKLHRAAVVALVREAQNRVKSARELGDKVRDDKLREEPALRTDRRVDASFAHALALSSQAHHETSVFFELVKTAASALKSEPQISPHEWASAYVKGVVAYYAHGNAIDAVWSAFLTHEEALHDTETKGDMRALIRRMDVLEAARASHEAAQAALKRATEAHLSPGLQREWRKYMSRVGSAFVHSQSAHTGAQRFAALATP